MSNVGFTFAAYVYLVEAAHSFTLCPAGARRCPELDLGLTIALINMGGAALFLAAAGLSFGVALAAPDLPGADAADRLVNGAGSLCFLVSSFFGIAEILSD